jgi:KDO2-lipid IV(A) lauroyltransferase
MARAKPRSMWLEYLIYMTVRLVVACAQTLTIEQSYALARALGWLAYHLDKRHRQIGLDNLKHAFGDLYDDAQRDEIIRKVYIHFCMVIMEIVHTPRKIHLTNWRDWLAVQNYVPCMDKRITADQPMILLTGHYGNWELAGYIFGLFGFPTVSVARILDNPYLERYIRKFREKTGQMLVPKRGGYDQEIEVMKKNGMLGFLADQDAGQRGVFVQFFGRPASTHKVIALLAIEHKAPVVVGVARRIGPGFRYEFRCEDVIDPAELSGSPDDVRLLTQRYTSALERLIRQDPTQYLWLHRRWKNQPKAKAAAARESVAIAAP